VALQNGKLITPATLAEMRTTVAVHPQSDLRYGLGPFSTPLSCGGVAWGHGDDIPGYSTANGATEDGRAATLTVTSLTGSVTDKSVAAERAALVDAALCAK